MAGDTPHQPLRARGTDHLPAEPAAVRRQKLARITLDSMVHFVGLLDAAGTVLDVNQSTLDAAGITLPEVEGRPFWTTRWWQVSDEANQALQGALQRAARGEVVRWATRIYRRAEGTETRLVDASLRPVFDDEGTVGFICVEARDITGGTAQEQELAEDLERHALLQRIRHIEHAHDQRLHSLLMQAPTLIAVLSGPRHVIEIANDPICDAWGHRSADVVGRPLFDVMPELRGQGFEALLDGVYGTGTPHVGRETPAHFARPGGVVETKYFNAVYSARRSVSGVIEGVFIVASEVTEQVLGRHEVDDLRRVAEGANRTKDEFLAMLGHELRNPLSPILTALQLMKLRGPDGAERARAVIERQVTHLTRLVDDLLDVARIARGEVELKTEVVELAEVVARGIEMASPLLEERTHTMAVTVPRQGLAVRGDATRLSQVVTNLLTNAAKYTAPGGRITIRGSVRDDDVELCVRDTGMGIAPEVLPRIFDLFVQGRQAIDRSQGGLGLGLTIVRNLIERHGGSVSARSEGVGRGTEFVVRLPRVMGGRKGATPRGQAIVRDPQPVAGAIRVLIVDDNEDGAEMLAMALSGRGYDTRVAHDGPTALSVAESFVPDVAFLDIGLPVMDGYELAAHLRRIPGLADLRLVAVTGYGQESDRRRTLDAGFQHHLVKPVDIDAIEAALASAHPTDWP